MQRRVLHFALILSIAFWADCSRRPSNEQTQDEQIQKDIQTKAAADPDTKDSDVAVSAKKGKVTLAGKVPNDAADKKYKEIAKEEPGVSDVDDETTVDSSRAVAPPPTPAPIEVPAGTVLTVRTGQALSSKTSQSGQTFHATLAQPISTGGKTALPAGSAVSGKVVAAEAKGKIKGEGELDLILTSISTDGRTYNVKTNVLENTEKGKGKRTAATTGGGAAGGALIGGIAGGGKGAAIGALAGGGAGLLGGAATGNKQIEIPAESVLSFTLSQPLTLQPPS